MYSDTQVREVFHFCFLQRLLRTSDPGLYLLKGGVNLRFFFLSPRYSEDMDLDVIAGSVATLKKNGYKILEDAAFRRSLRTFGIDGVEVNDPGKAKHTETTLRFRCSLITQAGQRLPTKVEFSRRAEAVNAAAPLETINTEIARQYRQLTYRCRHYSGTAAVVQKIEALAGRALTQARDVFDLGILMQGGHLDSAANSGALVDAPVSEAVECLAALGWEDYEGQVVEFLDPASRAEFGTRESWNDLHSNVFEALEAHA
ncbi:MAG: nucleotidyl transferase AbiEii/AbiGii toxin family protein [Gammaproteobacteria bacterium]|nr:nucleotidyl transferase AbiEii/AbiGii toxin family protein [Gammaproteobacteria bacterium]MYG67462.1 nucleotidyl transferase AbiEii/AbiGii toxin family protein [Gammaproteobacteria bacterium]